MTDGQGAWSDGPVYPVALIILDGWGIAPAGPGNAVVNANTPNFDALWARYPHGQLLASGLAVGLPEGQIGNSEVGHLNLGAGRVVYQDLARIDRAVADGSFAASDVLQQGFRAVIERDATLHVIGLCSTGGVHSHLSHIEAAIEAAAAAGVRRILVHAITDGRDVGPDSAMHDLPRLEQALSEISAQHKCTAEIVTVIGRYWAMDRDRRWDRTQRAWDAFTCRLGVRSISATAAIGESHARNVTDEFVEPWMITGAQSGATGQPAIVDGDMVLLANFRPDRMRQLVHAFVDEQFEGFERAAWPKVDVICMTQIEQGLDLPIVFEPHNVAETLADVLEREGVGQLHVAETEKYAHVTYFFNGGVEDCHSGEYRVLVDSPRDVPTYDHKPEMSAVEVADRFVEQVADEKISFAVLNFANPDMVGHTGVLPAAISAVETADTQLQRVVDAVHARGGVCIVTADHGNAEVMLTPEGKPHTAHTTNPVPIVITAGGEGAYAVRAGGKLADVAPTVLELLGIAQPNVMTGSSLIARAGVSVG